METEDGGINWSPADGGDHGGKLVEDRDEHGNVRNKVAREAYTCRA